MIVTAEEMKRAEEAAVASGASIEGLMEAAGEGIAGVVEQFFPSPGKLTVFCGKGHNGGDALVAARKLIGRGWSAEVRLAYPEKELAPLTRKNLDALRKTPSPPAPRPPAAEVVLDGLLGLGATGEPRGPIAGIIADIRRLRAESGCRVVSVDFPSGLDTATGAPSETCVEADITVALGAAKDALLADAATPFVGRIALVPLPGIPLPEPQTAALATPQSLRPWLPPRNFDTHKGDYGKVAIIAGSPGYFGAAHLCALGALRAGAGLVSVFTRPNYYALVASCAPPEAMVHPLEDFRKVLDREFDAVVMGPGLVGENVGELAEVFRQAPCPLVLDAGGFEIFGGPPKMLRMVNAPRILTPHPGEFARLYRNMRETRAESVASFVAEYPCVLLLKGARTVVGAPGRPLWFNTAGTPAMSTGGTGDVLAGVIGALAAQKLRPTQAAILGAWACARAAEIALLGDESEQSLTASLIPRYLGRAFRSLHAGCF